MQKFCYKSTLWWFLNYVNPPYIRLVVLFQVDFWMF